MTRPELVGKLGALFALAGGAGRVINAQNNPNTAESSSTFEAAELNHVALRVKDVPRSRDFYMKHLGLKLSREGGNNAFLTCGKNFVAPFLGIAPGSGQKSCFLPAPKRPSYHQLGFSGRHASNS